MQTVIRACFILAFAAAGTAVAQGFPARPIKLIVPWPPGQATDLYARLVADKLSQTPGQPLIVDNRAGAGGTIGSDAVARLPGEFAAFLIGEHARHGAIAKQANVRLD
jgi:tripartite-type tricarboxylate transporter receptor subunit TctC